MSDMLQKIWKKFQRSRKIVGYTGIVSCVIFAYVLLMNSIPDKMYVERGKKPDCSFGVPVTGTIVASTEVFATQQPVRNGAIKVTPGISYQPSDTYQVVCKLFGVVPVKQISVQEVSKKELLPAGTNIGIYVKNKQIMIIGTGEVTDESGAKQEPAKNVVQSGDYLLAVDGEKIETKDQLVKKISFCEGKKVKLQLDRKSTRLNSSH